jgi:protein tyrosine phosphatase (PTP) superfamily phosphohydrolase (DUF442 family)
MQFSSSHALSLRRAFVASLAIPLFAFAALAGGGGGTATIAAPTVTDSHGPLELPGITLKNFGVVDGHIFRGGQPSEEEYVQLKALGVKAVIDLRLDAKSRSRERAEAAGLTYINIPIDGHGTPTDDQAVAFIKAVDGAGGSVYVHCAGGRHRTGSMIAVYRMTHNGWNIDKAYGEMEAYDFYTRNGHKGFKTFVFDYAERMQQNPASVPVAQCDAH